ncbi:MAG TPA: trehalose-6-phosphate synthase [Rhizomicrobium sp.]|jgi:trehalose 6-phosphate synthase
MARLVVVSNRVPLPGQGQRAGGLAIVLQDVMDSVGLWFGWSGNTTPEGGNTVQTVTHRNTEYATIDLSEDEYQKFYIGYANSSLWPLLHFRQGLLEFRREDLEGYRAVNQLYSKSLQPLLQPDDLIWVHDYHLIPMGGQLRRLGVRNRVGFYLHIPFVPHSVFSALPQGDRLLQDMCEYDVVGFQTEEHRADFLDTVRQTLGHDITGDGVIHVPGRPVQTIVAPVGIDGLAFGRQAERAARSKNNKRLMDSLNHRHLMIGVDRLDYSKGLPNRFEAFNRLLTRFPEHSQHVSYLQVAVPSREEVTEYAQLRPILNRMAGDINGRHGTFDWVPLRYMSQGVSRSTLAGFHRVSRVGLVTPLRDGMNLVAHEYVAAQNPEDPGVLVLSRFAGAASYLQDALIVNPNDPDEIAEAMHTAFTMPLQERRLRHARLFESVLRLTARSYCNTFLNALSNKPGG